MWRHTTKNKSAQHFLFYKSITKNNKLFRQNYFMHQFKKFHGSLNDPCRPMSKNVENFEDVSMQNLYRFNFIFYFVEIKMLKSKRAQENRNSKRYWVKWAETAAKLSATDPTWVFGNVAVIDSSGKSNITGITPGLSPRIFYQNPVDK